MTIGGLISGRGGGGWVVGNSSKLPIGMVGFSSSDIPIMAAETFLPLPKDQQLSGIRQGLLGVPRLSLRRERYP